MPLPTPRQGEEQRTFVARCMGDQTVRTDFPDSEQRLAVCFSQWRKARQGGANLPWNHLLGLWAIDPEYLMLYRPNIEGYLRGAWQAEPVMEARTGPEDLIQMVPGHIAVIPLHGPIVKHQTLLGQVSGLTSLRVVQQAIAQAQAAEDVQAVMIHVESPGGHVAGLHEFAEYLKAARTQKPIVAHIEDLGASAAYWAVAHADRITANSPAEIGSLRTMAIVVDSSRQHHARGLDVQVITRAPYKGAGVEGTAITAEHRDDILRRVDAQDQFFMAAIQAGRQMSEEQLSAVTDGRVFIAREAKSLRLIDEVRSLEAALEDVRRLLATGRLGRERPARATPRRASLAALKEALSHATDSHE